MAKQPLIRATSLALVLSLVLSVLGRQTSQSEIGKASSPNDLREIYEEDQRDHSNADSRSRSERKERVLQLLRRRKVQTGEDYYYAGMVFQHSVSPRDLLFAHILAVSFARRGYNQGIWLAAASLDRYLQALKQPQVFGTQFSSATNGPDTQEPYDKDLVSDDLRVDWCVAPYSEQVKILADVNAGKPFRSTRLCK